MLDSARNGLMPQFRSASLRESIEAQSNATLFLILTLGSFILYLVQVPFVTVNQDVLIYAFRAHADAPILDSSYTNDMLTGNIHIVHTVALWLIYQVVPASVYDTVWPAGVFSAICGGFIVGLTFLIWEKLEVDRYSAFLTAVVVGIIPSIWYHNLIGEVYGPELCFVLAFLYCFCAMRYIAATFMFALALLTTPVAALSFPLVLLSIRVRQEFIAAAIVGALSVAIFLGVMYALSPLFYEGFMTQLETFPKMARGQALINLALIVVVNLNFLALFFLLGLPRLWRDYKRFLPGLLAAAIVPQLYLLYNGMAWFFFELGSFQLMLLWTLALPVGLALARTGFPGHFVRVVCVCATIALTIWNWGIVSEQVAEQRNGAGHWLKAHSLDDVTLIGLSDACLPISFVVYDNHLDRANQNCIEHARPDGQVLLDTGLSELIVVDSKVFHPSIRNLLAQFVPGLKAEPWDASADIQVGTLTRLYENDSAAIYRWAAPVE